MKLLEYSHGYINLNYVAFFDILIKKKDTLECWLECPGRDIFIFSFEQEKDARKFRSIFWNKIKKFLLSDKEEILDLTFVIHEIVPEFFKESND